MLDLEQMVAEACESARAGRRLVLRLPTHAHRSWARELLGRELADRGLDADVRLGAHFVARFPSGGTIVLHSQQSAPERLMGVSRDEEWTLSLRAA